MSYTADLTRHYAEVRARLMIHDVADPPKREAVILPLPPPKDRWKIIAEEVANKYGITVFALLGKRGKRAKQASIATRARHETMYRLRHEMKIAGAPPSYPQIGRWLNRDHATVIHGIRKHASTKT